MANSHAFACRRREAAVPFVPLLNRTAFTFYSGAMSAEELARACTERGYGAAGLCDRDGLYAAVRFYKAAKRVGLRPILGAEISSSHCRARAGELRNWGAGERKGNGWRVGGLRNRGKTSHRAANPTKRKNRREVPLQGIFLHQLSSSPALQLLAQRPPSSLLRRPTRATPASATSSRAGISSRTASTLRRRPRRRRRVGTWRSWPRTRRSSTR